GAHRQRTVAQVGLTRVTAYHTQVSAQAPESWARETRDDSTLADLCVQSCPGHRGLRFLCGGHRNLSPPLRVRRHGTCYAPHPAYKCQGASNGFVAAETAAQSLSRGPSLPILDPCPR